MVIGAGPAGLATSRELARRAVSHVVLERDAVGASWARLYDSLTLHTGKHMSHLPGLRFRRSAPLFLSRESFLQYLHDYHARFELPVESGVEVTSLRREGEEWIVNDALAARSLVVATGIISNPRVPRFEGMDQFAGVVRHSITYRRPEECRGRRVLVIGAGNSAGEIASELGRAGVDTTIAVRSGAHVVPLQILGIPIQYIARSIRVLPRPAQNALASAVRRMSEMVRGRSPIPRPPYGPLDAIPIIGFRLVDAIKAGAVKLRGDIEQFTRSGVRFRDADEEPFDEVLLATGFRAALPFLGSLARVDQKGFAVRRDRIASADHAGLYFVGHNYDSTGGLTNIRRDAVLAAEAIAGQ